MLKLPIYVHISIIGIIILGLFSVFSYSESSLDEGSYEFGFPFIYYSQLLRRSEGNLDRFFNFLNFIADLLICFLIPLLIYLISRNKRIGKIVGIILSIFRFLTFLMWVLVTISSVGLVILTSQLGVIKKFDTETLLNYFIISLLFYTVFLVLKYIKTVLVRRSIRANVGLYEIQGQRSQ